MDLVDFTLDDLQSNYVFSGDEYPLESEFETPRQKRQRKIIVNEWIRTLKGWQATAEQKANILTMLFYAIWSKDFAARTNSVEPSDTSWYATSPNAYRAESPAVRTKSRRTKSRPTNPNRDISFQQETGNERIRPDVQPRKILQYLLQKTVEKHGKRYSGWLEEHPDAEERLSSFLNAEVWEICEDVGEDGFTLDQSVKPYSHYADCPNLISSRLFSIRGDLSYNGLAIYLHILWDPETELYTLYVGQSEVLRDRLGHHENPYYREKYPSLHYHVWDSRPADGSAWVVLARDEQMDSVALNLMEAWCSLIFQTLQIKDLLEYLPPGTILFPHAGTHLNVAHPLWQGFAKSKDELYALAERRKAFSDLIRNSEGEYREYYQSLSRNFKDLKYSTKDALREYYLAADQRRAASYTASSRKRIRERLLHGVVKKMNKGGIKGGKTVTFGIIDLRFPASICRMIPGEVFVQGFLTPGLNPNVYATGATSEDPARRLSIQLTIEDDQGHFQVWVTAGGDQTAKQINTLVEILEGVPGEEIAKRPRRFLGQSKYIGRLRRSYTS